MIREGIYNMDFRELLNDLKGFLPDMAILGLPLSLSRETQQRLCELGAAESGKILTQVIRRIDSGSVETIETLTQEALNNRRKKDIAK